MKLIKPFFFAAENNKAQKALNILKKNTLTILSKALTL